MTEFGTTRGLLQPIAAPTWSPPKCACGHAKDRHDDPGICRMCVWCNEYKPQREGQ